MRIPFYSPHAVVRAQRTNRRQIIHMTGDTGLFKALLGARLFCEVAETHHRFNAVRMRAALLVAIARPGRACSSFIVVSLSSKLARCGRPAGT